MSAPDEDLGRDLGEPELERVPVPSAGPPYNPEPHRELLRSVIALASLALFAAVVLMLLSAVIFRGQSWSDVQGPAAALLPTVTGVVSAALGFYFFTGEQTRR